MSKLSFNKLGLNKEEAIITTIKFNEQDIEVKSYLDLEYKQDIVDGALSASASLPFVNRLVSDAYFNYLIVLSYTNLEITTKKEKENPVKVYDLMEKSGLIDAVFNAIPEQELDSLIEYYEKAIQDYNKYKSSIRGMIEEFAALLPQTLDSVNSALSSLDAENLAILNELKAVMG